MVLGAIDVASNIDKRAENEKKRSSKRRADWTCFVVWDVYHYDNKAKSWRDVCIRLYDRVCGLKGSTGIWNVLAMNMWENGPMYYTEFQ